MKNPIDKINSLNSDFRNNHYIDYSSEHGGGYTITSANTIDVENKRNIIQKIIKQIKL